MREIIREVSGCLFVFCLLLSQESSEGNNVGVDLLLLNRGVAVGSHDCEFGRNEFGFLKGNPFVV